MIHSMTRRTMHWRKTAALLVAGLALAGCSGNPFGSKRPPQPSLLLRLLHQRADFFNTMISAPALKPVADSPNLHYVVCLQFNARVDHRNKVVIFLGGSPTQYIDADPKQCGDAAYGPFPELQAAFPGK